MIDGTDPATKSQTDSDQPAPLERLLKLYHGTSCESAWIDSKSAFHQRPNSAIIPDKTLAKPEFTSLFKANIHSFQISGSNIVFEHSGP
ncbi:MAG: hypothetical protein DWI24_01875 [Planctomycetota bacterium]|nr:MAG: hypothetical protein DWI24_01875 [Planctomycetota bacterium]